MRVEQEALGLLDAPGREVLERRLAHDRSEGLGERGATHRGALTERRQRPRGGRLGVDGLQGLRQSRIAQGGENTVCGIRVVRPEADGLHEEHFGQAANHDFVSGAGVLDLAGDEAKGVLQRRVAHGVVPPHDDRRRQLVEQGVLHRVVEGEVPADQARRSAAVLAPVHEGALAREARRPDHVIDGAARRVRRVGEHVLRAVGNEDEIASLEQHGSRQGVDLHPTAAPHDQVEPRHAAEGRHP